MAKAVPLLTAPDFPERFGRLTALEQAQTLARGKRRHERNYPATAHGGDRQSAAFRAGSNREDRQSDVPDPERYGFTDFAARVLGCTTRSIQVTVRIAERIPPALQAELADTRIAERKRDLVRISNETPWRAHWERELAGLPSHTDSRFWITSGLLLPIWNRLPDDNMRVRRLTTDDGEQLIGRVLDADQVRKVRKAFNLEGSTELTGEEAYDAILNRGTALPLSNGWRLTRRSISGDNRVELEGPDDTDTEALRQLGCTIELINWRARIFPSAPHVLDRIFTRWLLAA